MSHYHETISDLFAVRSGTGDPSVVCLSNGPVVVYFYPSAFTGGCNIQAHEFAVNKDKFTAAGASIIGVSLDSIERLNDFSADPAYCGGKIPVASDVNGRIARSAFVRRCLI